MEINVGLGNREPEEIVERLLRKLRQKDLGAAVAQALEFLTQMNELVGPPAEHLPRGRRRL